MSEPSERGNTRGQRTSHETKRFRRQVFWGIGLSFGAVVVMFLLMLVVNDGTGRLFDQARAAVTAAGVITIGGGAVIAYNRQVTLMEQAGLEHSKEARAGRADLHARYQQAAAQLGHEKTMIRIAGVYALEALAKEWDALDDGRAQRDVCIDLLCGYLKSEPEFEKIEDTPTNSDNGAPAPVMTGGEAEVRLAITTVINRNLRDPETTRKPGLWSDHDYDFTNAYFAPSTNFNNATFTGDGIFYNATFTGDTGFRRATFTGNANFDGATFTEDAWLNGAMFTGNANFAGATFTGDANFDGAAFTEGTNFGEATFTGNAYFGGPTLPLQEKPLAGARVKAPFLTESLRDLGALELELELEQGHSD